MTFRPPGRSDTLAAILIMLGRAKLSVVTMMVFGLSRSMPLVLMTSGILADASPVGGGARAIVRRRILHGIADRRAMWVLRTALSIACMVEVSRQW